MTDVDLLGVARRVAGDARTGEQVEAYVAALARRRREGVRRRGRVARGRRDRGRRRPRDRRPAPGLRVGGLARRRRRSPRRSPTRATTPAFGAPDEFYGLAPPGRRSPASTRRRARPVARRARSRRRPPTRSRSRSSSRPRRRAIDPRVRGVESASYGDAAVESRGRQLARRRGVDPAHGLLVLGVRDGRRGRPTPRPAAASPPAAAFAELDPREGGARRRRARGPAARARRRSPSRRLPVVLDPLVTRSLLALVGGALSGEAISEGSLAVRRARGRRRSPAPGITLVDDPTIAEAFGAATHDAEGVPTRRVALIAGGRLDAFLHNVYTARRGGTAHAPGRRCAAASSRTPGVGARCAAPRARRR